MTVRMETANHISYTVIGFLAFCLPSRNFGVCYIIVNIVLVNNNNNSAACIVLACFCQLQYSNGWTKYSAPNVYNYKIF